MSLPDLDISLFFLINHGISNSFFDLFMPFLTDRSYVFYLPVFLYFLFRNKKDAVTVLVLAFGSLLLTDWFSYELKNIFARTRPCHVLEQVRLLKGCSQSFSLPSNHASNAFAFATPFIVLLKGRVRYAMYLIAFLVALSRVYVGVHYPSDILAGALFGIAISLSVIWLHRWSSLRFRERPSATVFSLALFAISLFRIYYILHGPLDLSPDEAHYWEWSRRLDISYYSKGPMIAYLIFIGTQIFGDRVIGIRIMAVLFSLLSSIVLYLIGKRLFDEKTGVVSGLLFQAIPLFAAFGVIFTIDSPFIFFWIASLYLFLRAAGVESFSDTSRQSGFSEDEERSGNREILSWIFLGLSIGLGLLTKYTMAFFLLSGFLYLLFSGDRRGLLFKGGPHLVWILSLVIFSPVILWNINHDWVTIRHTAGQAHVSEGFRISFVSFLEFVGSQFGVITPLVLGFMTVAFWEFRKTHAGRFLIWFSFPVIMFFLLKSLQGKVQANWALPGYITGVIAFSAYSVQGFSLWSRGRRILLSASIVLAVAVTAVAHYPSLLGLPVKLDPSARLRGWKELGLEVTRIHEKMTSSHPVFIFSDRYQISSELAFYVRGNPVTYCVNLNRRMNQYDLWPGFGNLIGHHAIFVRQDDSGIPERIASAFGRVEKKVVTTYTKQHGKIRDYTLYLCYDFRGLQEAKPGRF
ncbi:MAG: glycosyltransferase family 39 protein [Nitrospirota bacterium]